MGPIQNWWSAIKAPFLRREWSAAEVDQLDQSIGNGYSYTQLDVSGLNELETIGYDNTNNFKLGNAVQNPVREPLRFHVFPNASLVDQTFFVNPTPYPLAITLAMEVHTTAGSVVGANVTVNHETQVGGLMQAAGTGKSVLTTAFDEHATAATVQTGTLAAGYLRATRNINVANPNPGSGLIVLQAGDSLSANFGGTQTTAAGVTITVYVQPGSRFEFVNYYLSTAGAAATASLMTSLRTRTLLYGAAVWQVKESTAATLTLDVTKDATATVPGAGTTMLSATVNLKTAALTYTQLALTATAANLNLISTDSVAIKISASNNELAGLCVTLAFDGKQNEISVHHSNVNSTVGTDEEFFIADRDYEVADFAAKWSTVSTSNTSGLTKEIGTQTPSSGGIVLQTDNTNAGFLTSGTINTPVFAALSAINTRFLAKGNRLGIKNAGTLGGLAGLQVSVRLIAR